MWATYPWSPLRSRRRRTWRAPESTASPWISRSPWWPHIAKRWWQVPRRLCLLREKPLLLCVCFRSWCCTVLCLRQLSSADNARGECIYSLRWINQRAIRWWLGPTHCSRPPRKSATTCTHNGEPWRSVRFTSHTCGQETELYPCILSVFAGTADWILRVCLLTEIFNVSFRLRRMFFLLFGWHLVSNLGFLRSHIGKKNSILSKKYRRECSIII